MAPPPLPRIGAHVSMAGGLARIVPRARDIGAEAVQIFPQSPRQWRGPAPSPADVEALRSALDAAGLPLFLHAIYLVNPASPDEAVAERSADALARCWALGARVGAHGVVTHLGSHRGEGFEAARRRVARVLGEARRRAAVEAGGRLPPLLLETSAGGRGSVGATVEELARLLADAPPATGLCLDTAHLFAAGHPVHEAEGVERWLDRLDREVGLARVALVHLNDSRTPLGSGADRHENLGEGHLGLGGLGAWVRCERLRRVPFVLETPGFDDRGPDRRNVRRAKRLRAGAGQSAPGAPAP